MIVRCSTRMGAIMLSQGNTIGEIAQEINCTPEQVWRSIRGHVYDSGRRGVAPGIQPEKWLWEHTGWLGDIKVIRTPEVENNRATRNTMVS